MSGDDGRTWSERRRRQRVRLVLDNKVRREWKWWRTIHPLPSS